MKDYDKEIDKSLSMQRLKLLLDFIFMFDEAIKESPEYDIRYKRYQSLYKAFYELIKLEIKFLSDLL